MVSQISVQTPKLMHFDKFLVTLDYPWHECMLCGTFGNVKLKRAIKTFKLLSTAARCLSSLKGALSIFNNVVIATF